MKKKTDIINHRNSERIKELHMKTRLFSKTEVLRIFQWMKYSPWLHYEQAFLFLNQNSM